jgi:uncharacterized membrane protein
MDLPFLIVAMAVLARPLLVKAVRSAHGNNTLLGETIMSKDTAAQVVAAFFGYEDGAKFSLEMLEEGGLKKALGDKALLSMDYNGKVSIKEMGDMGGGKGAVIGGALGLLLPGIGTVVGVAGGALIGGLAAKLHDAGFPNDQLKSLGEQLKPNSSLLLAVVDSQHVVEVEAKLRSADGRVITEGLTEDAIDQLAMTDFATDSAMRTAVVAALVAEAPPAPADPTPEGAGFATAGEDAAR